MELLYVQEMYVITIIYASHIVIWYYITIQCADQCWDDVATVNTGSAISFECIGTSCTQEYIDAYKTQNPTTQPTVQPTNNPSTPPTSGTTAQPTDSTDNPSTHKQSICSSYRNTNNITNRLSIKITYR